MPTLKLIFSIVIGISISKSPTTDRNTIFSALIFCDPSLTFLRDQDMLFYQEKSCAKGKK
jgi:hypothetical protein